MNALDLSSAPPRIPRAELAGIVFLPRSIDKVRGHLPGGNPGGYVIAGFTQMMLDTLGISLDEFQAVVASAPGDDDVAAFVVEKSTPEKRAEWNAFAAQRRPRNGDRAAALEVYPWLNERPDLILALDVLEEDDRQLFAGRAAAP